ncbi:MAG: helix-turn-helix transcriptional regulator [Treponema sp.]|nr:helix-turn-helix transcriptional regulator [Treponema sp.]
MPHSAKQELSQLIEGLSQADAARVLKYAKSLASGTNPCGQSPAHAASAAAKASSSKKTPRKADILARLQKMREAAQTNPEKWTVDAMAESFGLTRSRFSVLYKQTFGVAPDKEKHAFLNQKARSLLSTTDKTVQQIAAECGYNECENFIRAFRKSNGMSPLQYRKQSMLF